MKNRKSLYNDSSIQLIREDDHYVLVTKEKNVNYPHPKGCELATAYLSRTRMMLGSNGNLPLFVTCAMMRDL